MCESKNVNDIMMRIMVIIVILNNNIIICFKKCENNVYMYVVY